MNFNINYQFSDLHFSDSALRHEVKMTVTHTENALEAIQGQTFVIPSFLALFGEMSSPLHGGYACLRRSIDELIPRYNSSPQLF